MSVACLGAPGVGSKSKLTNSVGDSSAGDFASKLFVARARGFGGSGEKNILHLS